MIWLCVVLVIFIIYIVISAVGVELVVHPKLRTLAETEKLEKEYGNWGNYDSLQKQTLDITSYDGYILHGNFISTEGNRYVILTHGHTYTRNGSVKYAVLFHRLGYNVYLYDLRHHGANKRCACSMGELESKDVAAIVSYFREAKGNDITIGLQGESLGAATSMLALKQCTVDFCVEDCGFANLRELLKYQLGHTAHLPVFFIYGCFFCVRIRYGFHWNTENAIDAVRDSICPMLFIHGTADTYVLPKNAQQLFDCKKQGEKELFFFPGAAHAESCMSDRDRYFNILSDFLKKNNLV